MSNRYAVILVLLLTSFSPLWAGDGANPCAVPVPARAFWIPQFGHGPDGAGNQLDVLVKILNLNAEEVEEDVFEARDVEFEIVSCSEQGEPLNMLAGQTGPQGEASVSSMMLTSPPNGTLEVASLNESPASEIDVGYAIVRTLQALAVEVVFNIRTADGFLTSTNVPIFPLVTATAFFVDIDSSTPLNTGVAFLFPEEFTEPDERSSRIDLFLLNQAGAVVDEHFFLLDRGHKTARFLFDFFDVAQLQGIGGQPFKGSLEIRATGATAFLPLRQEGLVLTTQSLFPPRVLRR